MCIFLSLCKFIYKSNFKNFIYKSNCVYGIYWQAAGFKNFKAAGFATHKNKMIHTY
jgi:hypothetical protein